MRRSVWWWIAAISFIACTPGVPGVAPVFAADLKLRKKAPPPVVSWWDTFTINGHTEAGVAANGDSNNNFGHLFTDRANSLLFNQDVLTIQRPLDPKATDYDFGFKFQMMYGSDARYTHFL